MRSKTWRICQFILVGLAIVLPLFAAGQAIAQIQRDQDDRDERRIERRVDGLQKSYDELRLDIEKRLTKIETYMAIGVGALGVIFAAVAGQIGMGVVSRTRAVRVATASNSEEAR